MHPQETLRTNSASASGAHQRCLGRGNKPGASLSGPLARQQAKRQPVLLRRGNKPSAEVGNTETVTSAMRPSGLGTEASLAPARALALWRGTKPSAEATAIGACTAATSLALGWRTPRRRGGLGVATSLAPAEQATSPASACYRESHRGSKPTSAPTAKSSVAQARWARRQAKRQPGAATSLAPA